MDGQVSVVKGRWGSHVKGTITLDVEGYLPDDDMRDNIPADEAKKLLEKGLESLADDGYENIMNSEVTILL